MLKLAIMSLKMVFLHTSQFQKEIFCQLGISVELMLQVYMYKVNVALLDLHV